MMKFCKFLSVLIGESSRVEPCPCSSQAALQIMTIPNTSLPWLIGIEKCLGKLAEGYRTGGYRIARLALSPFRQTSDGTL